MFKVILVVAAMGFALVASAKKMDQGTRNQLLSEPRDYPFLANFDIFDKGDTPILKCGGDSTTTTVIGTCNFDALVHAACEGEHADVSVTVTETGSGISADGCVLVPDGQDCKIRCSSESDCQAQLTPMISDIIAYMYRLKLGYTIAEVEAGMCSCSVDTSEVYGETFSTGVCLSFASGAALNAHDFDLKAYATGADPHHTGYEYNYNCAAHGFSNDTDCADALTVEVIDLAIHADETMSGIGGWYIITEGKEHDPSPNYPPASMTNPWMGNMNGCPYGSSSYAIALFNNYVFEADGTPCTWYICLVDGVTDSAYFGGMFMTSSKDPPHAESENLPPGHPNPWTGQVSCPHGFTKQNEQIFYMEMGGQTDWPCQGGYDDDCSHPHDDMAPPHDDDVRWDDYYDDDGWRDDFFDDDIEILTDDYTKPASASAPGSGSAPGSATSDADSDEDTVNANPNPVLRREGKGKGKGKGRGGRKKGKSLGNPYSYAKSAEIHMCLGPTPGGLLGGGYQTCDPSKQCSSTNIYTKDFTCPEGYVAVQTTTSDCPYSVVAHGGFPVPAVTFLCINTQSVQALGLSLPPLVSTSTQGKGKGKGKDVPAISKDFECHLEELDSAGEVILRQTLVWSATHRRSRMFAEGSLVNGAMQQIKRCDLLPADGWFSNEGGPNAKDPSTWSCTNTTIPARSESPENCVYGDFWSMAGAFDVRYNGVETIRGKKCDMWSYKAINPNDNSVMNMWFAALEDQAVPCASGRTDTYSLYVSDFKGQEPDIQDFAPVAGTGNVCPDATPGSSNVDSSVISSLRDLHILRDRQQQW